MKKIPPAAILGLACCLFVVVADVGSDVRPQTETTAQALETLIKARGVEAAVPEYRKSIAVNERYASDEKAMNALGYRYLQAGKTAEAIAAFEINVAAFPRSWNAWDSLAEAHMGRGDQDKAEKYYVRSIALNPGNQRAKDNLSQLRGYRLDAAGETKEALRFLPGAKTGIDQPYFGQTPPGAEPRVFAPGIVSTAGNFEFAVTFSPDGREIYFTRRKEGGRNTLMTARWEPGGWTAPAEAAVAQGFPANEPHVSPDGRKLFFGCDRPRPGRAEAEYGIWVVERIAAGAWGEPRYHGPGMYVSTARNGNLYMMDFSGQSGEGVALFPWADGRSGPPALVGGGVNSPRPGVHAFIAPDESTILFDSYTRPGAQGGEGDLFVCFRKPDGSWSEAFNLGDAINTPGTNFCPSVSPDGRYIFYSTCRDIYWVSAKVLDGLRAKALKTGGAPPAGDSGAQSKVYPIRELQEDLDTLWAVLDEGHAGLERYTPREALKSLFDETTARWAKPLTEIEFYRTLLPLIAAIKDGHTWLRMSASGQAELLSRPVFFPFELRFVEGKAHIFRNLGESGEIPSGAETLAINGLPMAEILAKLLSVVPCDAGILTRRLRLLENPNIFGLHQAVVFGPSETFQLRIRGAAGAPVREVTVPGIKGADIPGIIQSKFPASAVRKPLYELGYRGGTAVITIRGFGDDQGPGRIPYPEFIRKTFVELADKKIETLIIDVRGNGGGADEYGRMLFAHFMDRPFPYYRALEMKKDRFDLFKYVLETQPDWAGSGIRKNARGWYDVLDHPNVGTMKPEAPRFTGRTCILVDGLSFSTTGESTSLFHFHKKAVFVGQECGAGYYGNTSGAMPQVTLPRTRIQLRIPLILYTLAVDGYPKDRGIVPDIAVAPSMDDLLARRDVVMERALEFLQKK